MTDLPSPALRRPVRIANCSGFYGDRLAAAQEMVEGGPIDILTGDYLAELTMLIPPPGTPARSSPSSNRFSGPASTAAPGSSATRAG
jgi:hypothetical protein